MAYKPILAPQEFHEWLQRRAERLTAERGERVSMAETLRELPAVVEATEIVATRQAASKATVQP